MKSLYEMMAFTVSSALSSSPSLFHFISLQRKKKFHSIDGHKENQFSVSEANCTILYMNDAMMRNIATLCFFYLFFISFSSFNGELLWESTLFFCRSFPIFSIRFFFLLFLFFYISHTVYGHFLYCDFLYTLLNYSFTFIFNANFSKRILSKKVGGIVYSLTVWGEELAALFVWFGFTACQA